MKIFSKWTSPVAVSLLLHAALLALLTYQMSATGPDKSQLQTLTVELMGKTPMSASKPPVQAPKSVIAIQPVQAPDQAEPVPVVSAIPQESQTTATKEEKQSISSQEANSVSDLVIQPLSKLTRPPSYLHKIEPVYPLAEQRAGSQANVLAEVTIDDKGNVMSVRIVKSAGKHFDEAVVEALKKSMFVPGYINREAVAVRVLVPFRFNLK